MLARHPQVSLTDPLCPYTMLVPPASGAGHAAVFALGCVSRGDTRHFEHVADRGADGLLRVALDYRVPVANGVLAVDEQEDAERRAGGSHGNKGEECALVALEMASLLGKLP